MLRTMMSGAKSLSASIVGAMIGSNTGRSDEIRRLRHRRDLHRSICGASACVDDASVAGAG
jgi:hypothetical protein